MTRPHVAVIRRRVVNRPLGDDPRFGVRQPKLQGVDDLPRNLLLDREHVLDAARVFLGPYMRIVLSVDELGRNAKAHAGTADAAFEQVANLQLSRDGSQVLVRALEVHRGGPGDHAQCANH